LISVTINGEARQVPEGLTLRSLLDWLAIDADRVAVELDREIRRKTTWAETAITPGAEIEIVMFVGGGK
jgi:sulfur carrier protein